MTKLIITLFAAFLAGGFAWVMQGVGSDASIMTWALYGAIAGLVGSFLIGA